MKTWLNKMLVVVVPFVLPLTMSAQPAQRQRLSGHVPAAVTGLQPLSRLPATNILHLVIGLPLRNRADLTNLLQRLYDPASADYHHYLTADQFAEQFGPTRENYQSVSNFAIAHGLKVTGTHPNRTLLDVSGPAADVEKTFHVTLHTYQHPKEPRTFFAPDSEPSLDLAIPVLKIAGLDTYVVPRPAIVKSQPLADTKSSSGGANPTQLAGSGLGGSYMGKDFRAAYVPGVHLTGSGQIVGLFECDGYNVSDITNYESQAGLSNVTLINVPIDGGVTVPGGGALEVCLDIEVAISMAPGLASVMVYEAPTDPLTDGSPPYLYDMLNRMATDNLAKQISSSWVWRSDASLDQAFMQFAAQGQSFFQASGDEDAYTANTFQWEDDPYVTLVGGTTLTTSGPGGAWVSETVWNWGVERGAAFDGAGTGGGFSTNYLGNVPIPSWQQGVNMTTNGGSTTMRNIPDVALIADNVFVYDSGPNIVGGTSCAAPLWAAFIALVNQQALANGGSLVGFMNPTIYALGQGPKYASAFHDITTGNNTWSGSTNAFYAVPGYDLCTGWGTPGTNLINILTPFDALQITPPTGFIAFGPVGGLFTVTSETLTLTNGTTNAIGWTLTNPAAWLDVTSSGGTLTPGSPATTVTVSLNGNATNLALGSYSATLWFTNLADGVGQSRVFALNVIAAPTITNSPASQAAFQGATVVFAVGATSAVPMTIQWQQNGTNLTDGGNVSGSASVVLTITNVSSTNLGAYQVILSNLIGAVTSAPPANLTITPSSPVILSQPASQNNLAGDTAQFTVAAVGNAPFSYQWYFDNAALTNATNTTLIMADVATNQSGTYFVTVSNSLGWTNSSNATLTVVPAGLFATFDDLSGSGRPVPGNYDGLTWSNFYYVDGLTFGGGYVPGTISASNVVYNAIGAPAAIASPVPFNLVYSYLTAAWNDDLQVEAIGYGLDAKTPTYDTTYTLSATSPTLIVFNYTGVTNVEFISSGGTPHIGYQVGGEQFVMDNVGVAFPPSPPVVILQPSNQTILSGGAATFSVNALGFSPLYYNWNKNGVPIAGATNSSYTTNNTLLTDTGSQMSCTVSNAYGTTNSTSGILTVLVSTLDHFAWSTVASPQGAGVPFPATITAQDSLGRTLTNYTGTLSLGAQTGSLTTNGNMLGSFTNQPIEGNDTTTLGNAFTPNANLTVTAFRTFWGVKASIWTMDGTLVASVPITNPPSNWTTNNPGVWAITPLTTPITLTAGQQYLIGDYTGDSTQSVYFGRRNMGYTFADGTINQSYETPGQHGGDTFPTKPESTNSLRWWFVDIVYTLDTRVPFAETPASTGTFVNGAWSGNVTIMRSGTNVLLWGDDGAGHTTFSNPFNVVPSLGISQSNGGFQVSITGSPGEVYNLMASTNLINWQTIATVTNITGTIQVVDPISTNFSRRYYLEVMQ